MARRGAAWHPRNITTTFRGTVLRHGLAPLRPISGNAESAGGDRIAVWGQSSLAWAVWLGAATLVDLDLVMRAVPPGDLGTEMKALVDRLTALPRMARLMTKRAVLAAMSAPGFQTNEFEPFLASLSIHARGG